MYRYDICIYIYSVVFEARAPERRVVRRVGEETATTAMKMICNRVNTVNVRGTKAKRLAIPNRRFTEISFLFHFTVTLRLPHERSRPLSTYDTYTIIRASRWPSSSRNSYVRALRPSIRFATTRARFDDGGTNPS